MEGGSERGIFGNKRAKKPCKFFQEGKCRYGNKCKNSHESSSSGSAASAFGWGSNSNVASGWGSSDNNNNNDSKNANSGSNRDNSILGSFFSRADNNLGEDEMLDLSGGNNKAEAGQAASKRSPKKICRNFSRTGKCKFGENCHFLHETGSQKKQKAIESGGEGLLGFKALSEGGGNGGDSDQNSNVKKNVCFNFQREGKCKFGDKCRFLHIKDSISTDENTLGQGGGETKRSARQYLFGDTLCLSDAAPTLKKGAVQKHFQKFGEVVSVNFNKRKRSYFIKMADGRSAANAFKKGKRMNGKPIKLRRLKPRNNSDATPGAISEPESNMQGEELQYEGYFKNSYKPKAKPKDAKVKKSLTVKKPSLTIRKPAAALAAPEAASGEEFHQEVEEGQEGGENDEEDGDHDENGDYYGEGYDQAAHAEEGEEGEEYPDEGEGEGQYDYEEGDDKEADEFGNDYDNAGFDDTPEAGGDDAEDGEDDELKESLTFTVNNDEDGGVKYQRYKGNAFFQADESPVSGATGLGDTTSATQGLPDPSVNEIAPHGVYWTIHEGKKFPPRPKPFPPTSVRNASGDNGVVGELMYMCHPKEWKNRPFTSFSVFELLPNKDPNPKRCVKEYLRSAAGKVEEDNGPFIRPPHILLWTMRYLTENVLDAKVTPRGNPASLGDQIYPFLDNRVRSIMNDLTPQKLPFRSIEVLVPCARFYVLFDYLGLAINEEFRRSNSKSVFEFAFNENELGLVKCLVQIEECVNSGHRSSLVGEVYSYYLLLGMDPGSSIDFVEVYTQMPRYLDKDPFVRVVMSLEAHFKSGNFYQFFKTAYEKATTLQLCILSRVFRRVRFRGLLGMEMAYRAGKQNISMEFIGRQLGLKDFGEIVDFLAHYKVDSDADNKTVRFTNRTGNATTIRERGRESVLEQRLQRFSRADLIRGKCPYSMKFYLEKKIVEPIPLVLKNPPKKDRRMALLVSKVWRVFARRYLSRFKAAVAAKTAELRREELKRQREIQRLKRLQQEKELKQLAERERRREQERLARMRTKKFINTVRSVLARHHLRRYNAAIVAEIEEERRREWERQEEIRRRELRRKRMHQLAVKKYTFHFFRKWRLLWGEREQKRQQKQHIHEIVRKSFGASCTAPCGSSNPKNNLRLLLGENPEKTFSSKTDSKREKEFKRGRAAAPSNGSAKRMRLANGEAGVVVDTQAELATSTSHALFDRNRPYFAKMSQKASQFDIFFDVIISSQDTSMRRWLFQKFGCDSNVITQGPRIWWLASSIDVRELHGRPSRLHTTLLVDEGAQNKSEDECPEFSARNMKRSHAGILLLESVPNITEKSAGETVVSVNEWGMRKERARLLDMVSNAVPRGSPSLPILVICPVIGHLSPGAHTKVSRCVSASLAKGLPSAIRRKVTSLEVLALSCNKTTPPSSIQGEKGDGLYPTNAASRSCNASLVRLAKKSRQYPVLSRLPVALTLQQCISSSMENAACQGMGLGSWISVATKLTRSFEKELITNGLRKQVWPPLSHEIAEAHSDFNRLFSTIDATVESQVQALEDALRQSVLDVPGKPEVSLESYVEQHFTGAEARNLLSRLQGKAGERSGAKELVLGLLNRKLVELSRRLETAGITHAYSSVSARQLIIKVRHEFTREFKLEMERQRMAPNSSKAGAIRKRKEPAEKATVRKPSPQKKAKSASSTAFRITERKDDDEEFKSEEHWLVMREEEELDELLRDIGEEQASLNGLMFRVQHIEDAVHVVQSQPEIS